MIEPMGKVSLIVYHKKVDRLLDALQECGVVHLREKKCTDHVAPDIALLLEKRSRLQNFLKLVRPYQRPIGKPIAIDDLLNSFEQIQSDIEGAKADIEKLKKLEQIYAPWGDFDWEKIQSIESSGHWVDFRVLKRSELMAVENFAGLIEPLSERGSTLYVMVIASSQDQLALVPGEPVVLDRSWRLLRIRQEQASKQDRLSQLQHEVKSFGQYIELAEQEINLNREQVDFLMAKESVERPYETVVLLDGWFPLQKKLLLIRHLEKLDGVLPFISEEVPSEEISQTPIKLKNGWFSSLFEPITKLFDLPHYGEFDLTPFFAPFFVFFFGMCLGDSGYGLIIVLAMLILAIRSSTLRPLAILGLFLGLSTVVWGVLGGTLFGMNLLEVHIAPFSSWVQFNSQQMFYLALLIGLVQIFFGMFIRFFCKVMLESFWAGLATIGWILLLFGLCVLYLARQTIDPQSTFVIGKAILVFCQSFPVVATNICIGMGIFLILFFNDVKANLFVRLGKGVWELYGITGVFGDLLSYIRLFALGISSAILGTVINSIGLQFLNLGIPLLSPVLFVGFMIIGHTANLLLSCLGSFVHPLRLTFVEFYKNAGFVGGGRPYRPLKKMTVSHQSQNLS